MATTYDQLITRLKERIQSVDWDYNDLDTGIVYSVGDGIAFVRGLVNVLLNEVIKFEDGTLGLALNLEMNQIGVIILGSDKNITEGQRVYRTQEVVQINVGDQVLGRVLNALGEPIDNLGPINTQMTNYIERPAPGVMDRQPVERPLFTGIKMIDAIIPIGKGQRELIIGDRQTGKTSIALTTILNQKGQNVKCVYVAIGQKASTVAQVVNRLQQAGAMEYTVVINSPADDSAALQYLAPYAGCAIAEYWMDQGQDTLVVYDDLSKHAVAYRTISLLLRRPSGREAYPGDVFYLHSRLLERAGQLKDSLGGGSMTALPIIETQLGDISSYIATNVISITDGQIFLNTEQFKTGRRPAIDTGLSVSRVGSAAQTPAMKEVSSTLKLDLAQFEEVQDFSQFSSNIDPTTLAIIEHGQSIVELLKQGHGETLTHWRVILSIYLTKMDFFNQIKRQEIRPFEVFMHERLARDYPQLIAELEANYQLNDSLKRELDKALNSIFQAFQGGRYGG